MFVLFLQSVFLNGALHAAGSTLQLPDNFVLTPQMKQIPAPVAPVPPAPIIAPIVPVPEGSLRVLVTSQSTTMVVQAGTVLAPGTPVSTARTTVASVGISKGRQESLVEIFHNGQWQLQVSS